MKYSEFKYLSDDEKEYHITNLYLLLHIVYFEFLEGRSSTLSKYKNTVEEYMTDGMHIMYHHSMINDAINSFKNDEWNGEILKEQDIIDYYNGVINKGSIYFYLYYNCLESIYTYHYAKYINPLASMITSLSDIEYNLKIFNKYLFNRDALKNLDVLI